tara:strand:+ start:465 stop:704 length:240 start_codon:yes stop_codon:yes gene_type:complete
VEVEEKGLVEVVELEVEEKGLVEVVEEKGVMEVVVVEDHICETSFLLTKEIRNGSHALAKQLFHQNRHQRSPEPHHYSS